MKKPSGSASVTCSRTKVGVGTHAVVILGAAVLCTTFHAGDAQSAAIAAAANLGHTGNLAISDGDRERLGSGQIRPAVFLPRLNGLFDGSTIATPASYSNYSNAWSFITSGRLDEAERMLRASRGSIPGWYEWLIDDGLGWIKFYRKDYEGARAAFTENVNRYPGAYLSRKGLGFVALEQKKYDEAFEFLKRSLRQNPYQVLPSYTVTALQFIEAGKHNFAKRILDVGEWVYPKSSDIKFLQARALVGLGDNERAAEYAVEAAFFKPAYIDPVFDDLGLPAKSVLEAYLSLGWGLMFIADNEGALRRFQQYLDNGGKNLNAIRGRGFALYRLGRYKEALADLELAAKSEPNLLQPVTEAIPGPKKDDDRTWEITYNATSTIAWARYFLKDFDGAKQQFMRVLEKYPDWIDARTGLGFSLLKKGDKRNASKEFRAALNHVPDYPYALNGLTLTGYSR